MSDKPASDGVVVWVTGLPAAGKSTFAASLHERLKEHGARAIVLDGDTLRGVFVPPPGYDIVSRDSFYATLAGLAALLANQGHIVLVAATAHRKAYRDQARALCPAFVEVFVDVPLAALQARDPKGLYAKLRAGEIRGVPGADVAYEPPSAPEVVARGGHDDAALATALDAIERARADTGGI
jgi:adenylylsulfate kinase